MAGNLNSEVDCTCELAPVPGCGGVGLGTRYVPSTSYSLHDIEGPGLIPRLEVVNTPSLHLSGTQEMCPTVEKQGDHLR